jgi:hypothetical protein
MRLVLFILFTLLTLASGTINAGIGWTGPVKVKEIRVISNQVYVRFDGVTTNFYSSCSIDWSVFPSNVPDLDRVLGVLLTAKSTGDFVEVGVVDNDCHEGFRRLMGVWIK